jgi:hypothetical protein
MNEKENNRFMTEEGIEGKTIKYPEFINSKIRKLIFDIIRDSKKKW